MQYFISILLICTSFVSPVSFLDATPSEWSEENAEVYDLVIYGGTSAGISAAIQTARMGKSVLLIEPSMHLGGMTTGGLVWTDFGKEGAVGGIAHEFYSRVTDYYRQEDSWTVNDPHKEKLLNPQLKYIKSFEPSVADSIYRAMLGHENIMIWSGERLEWKKGVIKQQNKIQSLVFESGKHVSGKIFIDATYEGDLLAMSGVSYHVGREPSDLYGESLAGVLPADPNVRQPKRHFNRVDTYIKGAKKMGYSFVDPYDEHGELLFGIQDEVLAPVGTGDRKVQAYNVRACLTSDRSNKIPITRPDGYDSTQYELLIRYIAAHRLNDIRQVLFKIDPVPNLKTDINDGCPFSTDYIGANWDYPEADYAQREEILQEHHRFTKGLLYFIGHDKRIPRSIRREMLRFGYPKDEYINNKHWTPQVYIRESRRMVGEYVVTQKDIEKERSKRHSIGLGSYSLDSHHVQRLVTDKGELINEGNFTIHVIGPYEIPYEAILPKRDECSNLLVPVCLSSSHVAFGSIRMEPVFMVLGESAAIAAALALNESIDLHDLNYEILQEHLLKSGQLFKIK